MHLEIQKTADAIALISLVRAYQGDLKKLSAVLFDVAANDFKQRFDSSPRVRSSAEVYGGVTWSRLSERYLKSNPRRLSGVQLVDTGLLRRSFTRLGQGNITTESATEVRFGSTLERAMLQHRRRQIVVDHPELGTKTAEAIAEVIEKSHAE